LHGVPSAAALRRDVLRSRIPGRPVAHSGPRDGDDPPDRPSPPEPQPTAPASSPSAAQAPAPATMSAATPRSPRTARATAQDPRPGPPDSPHTGLPTPVPALPSTNRPTRCGASRGPAHGCARPGEEVPRATAAHDPDRMPSAGKPRVSAQLPPRVDQRATASDPPLPA